MNLINEFEQLNFIYCPMLNYSCFNDWPIVGQSCQSNFMTLNIDETQHFDALLLYPNPSATGFRISNLQETSSLIVYNTLGEVVASAAHVVAAQFIDLSHVSTGIYTVALQTKSASKTLFWLKEE